MRMKVSVGTKKPKFGEYSLKLKKNDGLLILQLNNKAT